jgi:hypothetical protein
MVDIILLSLVIFHQLNPWQIACNLQLTFINHVSHNLHTGYPGNTQYTKEIKEKNQQPACKANGLERAFS